MDIEPLPTRGNTRTALDSRDPGLRVVDFIQAAQELDRLPNHVFFTYGLDDHATETLRQCFADWPRHIADDEAGRAVHTAVAADEARAKTAAGENEETPSELRAMQAAYPEGIDAALGAGQRSPPPEPTEETPCIGPDYRQDPPGRARSEAHVQTGTGFDPDLDGVTLADA